MIIYTAGYSGWKPEQLVEKARELKALVVDVRLSPRSRDPRWRGYAMGRHFGEAYLWLREFGNVNYKNGGPIKIADFGAGLARLRFRLAADSQENVILLCACKDAVSCHRIEVAKGLAVFYRCEIIHLDPPTAAGDGGNTGSEGGRRHP
jgi:uncharacterized protein (DUF488 family)